MNDRDPNNPAHWQPGDVFTIRTAGETFRIQTRSGMVYVAPHQYARFVMTEGGWIAAER